MLRSRLKKLGKDLQHLEGHKTIKERMEALEKHILELEKNPVISRIDFEFDAQQLCENHHEL